MSSLKFGANGSVARTPTLEELSHTRPEFKEAPTLWQSDLAPKLAALERRRSAVLKRASIKTGLAMLIPLALFINFLWLGPVVHIIIGLGAIALIAGLDWVRLFTVKIQTKNLVLRICCNKFGFTYDSLHPDISPDANWKDLLELAQAYASKYTKTGSAKPQLSLGGVFTLGEPSGPECPTYAYDSLRHAGLLPDHHIRNFEDLIKGERAEATFSLVEATLETTGKHGKTVFQGLLFHIEYPQDFLGKTVIARSGWWNRLKVESGLKKVKLVSSELEKAFSVYSNDQVEARALLTPDRMERLIALERHFKAGKLCGVFEGGHMTLALQAPDQFEAGSIFSPLVEPERYVHTLQELGLVCDVIDGFLTREWTKDKL